MIKAGVAAGAIAIALGAIGPMALGAHVVAQAIEIALEWLAYHVEAMIGTILVIGGITLVVIACTASEGLCVAVAEAVEGGG